MTQMATTAISVSTHHADQRGAYLMVMASDLGKCGSCGSETCCFITRNGRSECVTCDWERGIKSGQK